MLETLPSPPPLNSPPTTDQIVGALLRAHGSVSLAANYLKIDYETLVGLLPSIPLDSLIATLKVGRLLFAYDTMFTVNAVVKASLADLPPSSQAKLLIEVMDRFEVMVNPPVHGGSGQASQNNLQFNFGDVDDARAKLASRIVQSTASRPADSTPPDTLPSRDLLPNVRLGAPSEARTVGTSNALEHLVDPDRTWVGQDSDRSSDDSTQD